MATRDGLAQIWYADTNGVITGNTPNADNVASAIIDGYNEHFGTDIQIWTPETETLQVGDTVPTWNAYEKIMLPKTLFAFETNPNNLIVGEFEGGALRIQTSGNSNVVWLSSETGVIIGSMPLSAPALEIILQKVNEKFGTSFEGWTQLPTVYEVGSSVSDWASYNILSDYEKYAIGIDDYYLATKVIAQDGKSPINISNRGDFSNLLKINSEGSVVGVVAMSETLLTTIKNAISNKTGVNHENVSPQPVLRISDGSVFPLFEEYEKI